MIGPKEKKERALGTRLNLKAERSASPKSAVSRKPYHPGMHGQKRRRQPSDFGLQLKEKQKFKLSYGLKEKQLREIFDQAIKAGGVTRDKVFEILESRLDNVVYRLGLVGSRIIAHQAVRHGHIAVNGHRVNYPSFKVKKGDKISLVESSKEIGLFRNLSEKLKKYNPPTWLSLDLDQKVGEVISLPHDIDLPFDANLVVEFYSR